MEFGELGSGLLRYLRLLLQLFVELLYDVVLVIVEEGQVLDVHIRILKFLLQVSYLALLLLHDHQLGVDVLRGEVRDL